MWQHLVTCGTGLDHQDRRFSPSPSHSSVKRWSEARPLPIILAPECGLVVWWFPSFSPSVIHAAGGLGRGRTSEKASARMTEHISSFSTDFRIGSLPCVCARLLDGVVGQTVTVTDETDPSRRQTFIQCAFVLVPVFVSEIWQGPSEENILYESRASNVSQLFTNFVPNSVIHSRCRAPPI